MLNHLGERKGKVLENSKQEVKRIVKLTKDEGLSLDLEPKWVLVRTNCTFEDPWRLKG